MPQLGATYTFADLSSSSELPPIQPAEPGTNPYLPLLKASPTTANIIARYETHRSARFAQQKALMLSPDFTGPIVDPILRNLLEHPESAVDPRHNLPLWVRPPWRVKMVVEECQRRLREVASKMWMMPPDCLHMTAVEITHSRSEAEVEEIAAQMLASGAAQRVCNHTLARASERTASRDDDGGADKVGEPRVARLVRPMLGFDASAVALSFVPAEEGPWTYHHLRGELWDELRGAGVEVASRYVVPSAHMTVGRFVYESDLMTEDGGRVDARKVDGFVKELEEINDWLRERFWGSEQKEKEIEWAVGKNIGVDLRKGACWYGGGESVMVGEGFEEATQKRPHDG